MQREIPYNLAPFGDQGRLDAARAYADRTPELASGRIDPAELCVPVNFAGYAPGDHETWRTLFERYREGLEHAASSYVISGIEQLGLHEGVPNLDVVSQVLSGNGWSVGAVPGYLPVKAFFACLAARIFPVVPLIRPATHLDSACEPDIFHDLFGHAPLLTHAPFAGFMEALGKAALAQADSASVSSVERLARFFWFTAEFGMIREDGRPKVYGAGLLNSPGEREWAMGGHATGSTPELAPFEINRVLGTGFEIDTYQPLYFVADSFEQLTAAAESFCNA